LLFIDTLTTSIMKIFLFSLIPFIFYLFTRRTREGFLGYLGFFKPPAFGLKMGIMSAPLLIILGFSSALWPEFREIMISSGPVLGEFKNSGSGIIVVISIFLAAVFKIALAEEVLFRGFLARELINRLGFASGNAIQAFLFGISHVLWFHFSPGEMEISSLFLSAIFIGNCLVGYILGYLQVLAGRGSIIPNWISRSLTNLIAFLILIFYY